ncbi:MAG TPA: MFS transporter [Ornithinimicrobium sp.]|uniref:MFS transporter n=1 Tax=Ornithinimicrobium sp. TaxID=1977084 RepID=UPI002B45C9B4|nr:MFS transporter [Ornithinimicrobium sp.]HKJ13193.1 MFS transporter [Ornithinimicrobium sp.]
MTTAQNPSVSQVASIQTRTVGTLMASQTLGGVGVAMGIAVGALVAADVGGSDALAGLATTTQVLGTALFTIPIAALMAAAGRRVGLSAAYMVGAVGAVVAIAASVIGSFALLLLGTLCFGAATTANNQARYAAVDLAVPRRRGRQLSLVVWATTVGSVLGPNILGPGAAIAGVLGIPALAGAWVISTAGFALAILVLQVALRPDPLLTARTLESAEGTAHDKAAGGVRRGLAVILRNPTALLGTIAVAGGHVVMVSVMVMTPLHMSHGDAAIEVIGFVISLHILGMFGLAPVSGYLTDRVGAVTVVLIGVGLLLLACALAGISAVGASWSLTLGLFVLGLGWSCTMVAGSSLIAGSVEVRQRAGVQGAADVVMGLSAASAGALAGVVVDVFGFGWLCLFAALGALALGAYTATSRTVVSLSQ